MTLRPRDVRRTGRRKRRRWSPGLGLEVAFMSLLREESQESCRKRLNSCQGLWEAEMKSLRVSDTVIISLLPTWPAETKQKVIPRQLLSQYRELNGGRAWRQMSLSGKWENVFSKCFKILGSALLFIPLGTYLRAYHLSGFSFSPVSLCLLLINCHPHQSRGRQDKGFWKLRRNVASF